MQCVSVWLPLLLLLLLLPLRPCAPSTLVDMEDMEEMEEVEAEVIVDSSPCSATCGLGVKTQTLCVLKDGKTEMDGQIEEGKEVGKECRVRKTKCLESWQCGLRTVTVTTGQRLEMDCLEEVMEAMGRYSWRVSWRFARGIISSDDSLFARWEAALLDRVVLDPVREEDAGTYRCDVQDAAFRRVKRAYWGIRVLPQGVLHLDYESSLARWTNSSQNSTVELNPYFWSRTRRNVALIGFCVSIFLVALILISLYRLEKGRGRRQRRANSERERETPRRSEAAELSRTP